MNTEVNQHKIFADDSGQEISQYASKYIMYMNTLRFIHCNTRDSF